MGTDAGSQPRDLSEARERVRQARRALVLTGAGISAESGVPTFRGEAGLWHRHRPEDLATPEAFRRDPRLVWQWYAMRRQLVAACEPNDAHRALAAWVLAAPGRRSLVTQNVDGLHERALVEALDPEAPPLIEAEPLLLHGSLARVRCTACDHGGVEAAVIDPGEDGPLPHCPDCGALRRPDVVWFGEPLDRRVIERAFALASSADLCIVVGTSAVVHPAASLPRATLDAGGSVVEVNPDATPLSAIADMVLRGPAAAILPALLA